MFQFARLAENKFSITTLLVMGCPIRKSPDHNWFSNSPKLIAGYHVLHRLSIPRHPPYTLNNLLDWWNLNFFIICVQFSKNKTCLSQTFQILKALLKPRLRNSIYELSKLNRTKSKKNSFRKEVFHPHIPVRIPCYDLAPITNPTLNNHLPEGLINYLQVLPIFMAWRAVIAL
jgi:hypothetical protein